MDLISVNASVGGINVTGVSHDSQETLMVTADVGGDMGSPLVNFQLEMNPLDRPEMDIVVRTNVQPLKVIYDEVSGCGYWAWFIAIVGYY